MFPEHSCSYDVYGKTVKDKNISFSNLGNEECEFCEEYNLHKAGHVGIVQEECDACQRYKSI